MQFDSLRIPRFLSQNKAFAACVIFSLGVGISVSAGVVAVVDSARKGKIPFLQVSGGLVGGVLVANAFVWYMEAYRIKLETATRSTAAAIVLLLLTVLLSSVGPVRATWRRDLSHVLRD